jgi:hypothetical protein
MPNKLTEASVYAGKLLQVQHGSTNTKEVKRVILRATFAIGFVNFYSGSSI